MAEKYQQQFARNIKEEVCKEDDKKVVVVRFRGVLKYRELNPDYVEKPTEGKDTRTATQKRRYVWRQTSKNLECSYLGNSTKTKTRNAINSELSKWRDDMEAKEKRSSKSDMHVPAYVEYYISTRATGEEGIAASTYDNYTYASRYLDCKELDVPIADLTPDHVESWITSTARKGIGSSIRARSFSLLKYAVRHAINRGHRAAPNPCEAMKAPVSHRREPNPLNDENLESLNRNLDNLLDKRPERRDFVDAVKLALMTGMRQGEICALRWEDVDGWRTGEFKSKGLIHVNNNVANAGKAHGGWYLKECPKNGSRRSIPMNEDLATFMSSRWQYMNKQCLQDGIELTGGTFVLGKTGCEDKEGYLSPNYLGKMWRSFMDVTDLKGEEGLVPHFHDLRHTALTHMLRIGIPPQTVAGIAGHKDATTTLRYYSKFLHKDAEDAMQKMDGRMTRAEHQAPVIKLDRTGTDN